jgi:DUF1680 family protein
MLKKHYSIRQAIYLAGFFLLQSVSCGLYAQAQNGKVSIAVPDVIHRGDPSTIKLGGFLGGKMDACMEHRVKEQDVSHLTEPFFHKTETHRWQSEFWGKWMLGAAQTYRYTHDPVLMDSIKAGVERILASQLPNGYIGNYSEAAQLQQWDVWGRKYTLLGLLSYYDLTGDKKVLVACRRLADHLLTQLGPGKTNIVATGNYFGMASSSILEPMVLLYRRTADKRYLDFAEYIVAQWETEQGPRLLSKAEAGVPVAERFPHPASMHKEWFSPFNGQKAYEMMSCYEGLLELYKITGRSEYLSAVEKTARSIMDTEINIAGSGSAFECWYHGKEQQTRPTYHTMETCVTVTWMKLCQNLLALTGDPRYADQIEATAYNALLASLKSDASQFAMYSPLIGQHYVGQGQCGMHINCCSANGPRAFALLPQFAAMQGNQEIVVNLYTDFSAEIALDKKRKVNIKQQTAYPLEGDIKIRIDSDKPEVFTVALRIPAWSKDNSISVNGEILDGVTAGAYFKINRTWRKGDVIQLQLDVRARLVRENGHASLVKGPVVLARDNRFADGLVDEEAQIVEKDGYVELSPVVDKPAEMWMAFTAPLIVGVNPGNEDQLKQIHFCDFASAGNTLEQDSRHRAWILETLNVVLDTDF